jgi:hypothetical protein
MCLLACVLLAPDPVDGASPKKPYSATWLAVTYAGPRDESGPPVVLYVDERVLGAAGKHLRRDTFRKAQVSAEVMKRVVAHFVKSKQWSRPALTGDAVSARPFRFTFGGSGKPSVTNLEPEKARAITLELRERVLAPGPARELLAEFGAVYGWK